MSDAATPLIALAGADLHQEEHIVLSGVNLEARAGEFIYLIGRTGSGKSSLLKTLYGELPLTVGTGSVLSLIHI